jgi:hypothetical protein
MLFWNNSGRLFLPLNQIRRPISILAGLVCIAVMGHAQEAADFFS